MSKLLYASIAALLVSGVAAEHHVESYVTNVASASASSASLAEPGFVEAVTSTHTFAEGDDALAEAGALALASGEDWWGGADAAALSESVTLIEDGGIYVGALAEDEADQYGEWTAFAEAEAEADGAVIYHKFHKYWEPEPHPSPSPSPHPEPEPCDSWWCHEPEPCDSWWCEHEDGGEDGGEPSPDDDAPSPDDDAPPPPAPEPEPSGDGDGGSEPEPSGDGDGGSEPEPSGDGDGGSEPEPSGDGDGGSEPEPSGDGDGGSPPPADDGDSKYCAGA